MQTHPALLVVLAALALGPARADTNIYGIPGECRMETWRCSTQRDPARRPAPRLLGSVDMMGNWTYRAFSLSPDGQRLLLHRERGFRLLRADQPPADLDLPTPYNPRAVGWRLGGAEALVWVPARAGETGQRTLAAIDLASPRPGECRVVEVTPRGRQPYGFIASPSDDAIYTIETGDENGVAFFAVVQVDPAGRLARREVVRMPGLMGFVSRSPAGGPLLVGHGLGLFQVEPDGSGLRRVSTAPAGGVHHVAWHPTRQRVLLFFRRPVADDDGRTWRGVWSIDLDAAGRGEPFEAYAVQLDDATNGHTMWFSPSGRFMTWAAHNRLAFRALDGSDAFTSTAPVNDEGQQLDVKGAAWSEDEARLAFTVGNELRVLDRATGDTWVAATIGDASGTFLAQPTFLGDDVLVASFTDALRLPVSSVPPYAPLPPVRRDLGPLPIPGAFERPRRAARAGGANGVIEVDVPPGWSSRSLPDGRAALLGPRRDGAAPALVIGHLSIPGPETDARAWLGRLFPTARVVPGRDGARWVVLVDDERQGRAWLAGAGRSVFFVALGPEAIEHAALAEEMAASARLETGPLARGDATAIPMDGDLQALVAALPDASRLLTGHGRPFVEVSGAPVDMSGTIVDSAGAPVDGGGDGARPLAGDATPPGMAIVAIVAVVMVLSAVVSISRRRRA